jgi:hypothetical protein
MFRHTFERATCPALGSSLISSAPAGRPGDAAGQARWTGLVEAARCPMEARHATTTHLASKVLPHDPRQERCRDRRDTEGERTASQRGGRTEQRSTSGGGSGHQDEHANDRDQHRDGRRHGEGDQDEQTDRDQGRLGQQSMCARPPGRCQERAADHQRDHRRDLGGVPAVQFEVVISMNCGRGVGPGAAETEQTARTTQQQPRGDQHHEAVDDHAAVAATGRRRLGRSPC